MDSHNRKLNIAICLKDYLVTSGLKYLLEKENHHFVDFSSLEALNEESEVNFDLLIVDPIHFPIENLKELFLSIPKLAISDAQHKGAYVSSLDKGINSYVLNCCDELELVSAINATVQGERFFCAKVIQEITINNKLDFRSTCDGLNISERETEIIKLIAEGYTNKQIAEILFISGHTVTTHRKNIMQKLGINNTAGIVLFAVKEKIIVPNKFLFSSSQAS